MNIYPSKLYIYTSIISVYYPQCIIVREGKRGRGGEGKRPEDVSGNEEESVYRKSVCRGRDGV